MWLSTLPRSPDEVVGLASAFVGEGIEEFVRGEVVAKASSASSLIALSISCPSSLEASMVVNSVTSSSSNHYTGHFLPEIFKEDKAENVIAEFISPHFPS